MKRFLLFLLLFINLQIVVQYNGLSLCSLTKVYAQHQTREAGGNCYDMEIGWYHSPFSDCSDVHVDRYLCQYCHTGFDTELARLQHEKNCPDKPQPYNCSYCNQGFDNLAECQIHEENPCPQRYRCSKCGQSFNSQEELNSHTCGNGDYGGSSPGDNGIGGLGSGGAGGSSPSQNNASTPKLKDRVDYNKLKTIFVNKGYNRAYNKNTCGYCLRAWKSVWQDAGIGKYSGVEYAKDFGVTLLEYGFQVIATNCGENKPTEYEPQIGDTRVWDTYPGQSKPAGHINWWNGTNWVSDFKQNHPWLPGSKYGIYNVSYKIYR